MYGGLEAEQDILCARLPLRLVDDSRPKLPRVVFQLLRYRLPCVVYLSNSRFLVHLSAESCRAVQEISIHIKPSNLNDIFLSICHVQAYLLPLCVFLEPFDLHHRLSSFFWASFQSLSIFIQSSSQDHLLPPSVFLRPFDLFSRLTSFFRAITVWNSLKSPPPPQSPTITVGFEGFYILQ